MSFKHGDNYTDASKVQAMKKEIVERILGDEVVNKPIIVELSTVLADLANALNCGSDAVVNSFLHQFLDLNVRLATVNQTEKLVTKQEGKLHEITEETKKVNKLLQVCLSLKKEESMQHHRTERIKKEGELLKEKYDKVKAQLESIGFSEELDDKSLNDLENQLRIKKMEVAAVQEELSKYLGCKPSVKSLQTEAELLRKQADQIDDNLRRMSLPAFQ